MKTPKFFGLHASPGKKLAFFLMLIPFILVVTLYAFGSEHRHSINPDDKIMPTIMKLADTTAEYVVKKDRKGNYILLGDIMSSMQRLVVAVGVAAIVGLLVGMNMALFPGMGALLNPFIIFFSNIPALALMPMILIVFGTGDFTKMMLIFLGVVFVITRDVFRATNDLPKEQITKALSLGATQLEVAYKIVLPQIIPALISTVRLSLPAAWLFLIAGEAVVSMDGLGYRIYLVKRYLAMHIIIPYVFTITGLAFLLDRMLKWLIDWRFPWYTETKGTK